MSIEIWLAFVLASSILLVLPGPTILAVISYSITHGRRANVPLVAGVALGDSTALILSLLGLGALLATSSVWFTVIKGAGGLYLLWLGVKMLRAGAVPITVDADRPALLSQSRLFANTWLITALNPKGMVFFVAFLPQFVNPDIAAGPQLWLLGGTFVALASINAMFYAVFANVARRWLASPRAQRGFGAVGGTLLCGAGIWALLARRAA